MYMPNMVILPHESHGYTDTIRIKPFTEEHLPKLVSGLNNPSVLRWLLMHGVPTLQFEQEWLAELRDHRDTDNMHGGIFVEGELIGTTSLHSHGGRIKERHVAKTGKLIFNPKFWGKGISTAVSMARLKLIFDHGYTVAESAAVLPNIGSWRSLGKSGYFLSGIVPHSNLDTFTGKHLSKLELTALNSEELAGKPDRYLGTSVVQALVEELVGWKYLEDTSRDSVTRLLEELCQVPTPEQMQEKLATIDEFTRYE